MNREPEKLYKAGELPALLSISRSTWSLLVAQRQFPAADVILPGMSLARGKRWSASALAAWQDSRRVGLRSA
jgi:predicted DNA-binding transcriptional regulator AlpA